MMSQHPTPPPRSRRDEIAYALTAVIIAGAALCSVIGSCTPETGKEKGLADTPARPLPVRN